MSRRNMRRRRTTLRLLMMNILLSVRYGELETRIYFLTECENMSKLSEVSWSAGAKLQLVLSYLFSQNCWTSVPALAFIFAFQA